MRKRIIKDKSVAERHYLDFTATLGRIELSEVDEGLKSFNVNQWIMSYRKSGFKQVEYYASVSDDVLFDETAKIFSSISSVSYDDAYKMTQSIQKSVDDLFDKYPYLGVFHISSNEVFSASDILDDIEFLGRVNHSELYQKESLLYEFLSKIESNKALFYKVFYGDDFLYKVLELAKKGAEIDEFKIKGIDKNSTKEQFEDFNDRMRKLIASSQLENKDAITGRKVFDFLDYCNIDNYFDNQEVGIIREIADIFMAQRAAQYKQKLLTILDEKFNYGRVLDMSVDDVRDVIELLEYDSSYKKRGEVQQVTAAMVKDLRFETGCGMQDSKMVLERFGGDYQFAKTFLAVAGHAISVKGDRDERNLRVTIEKMGRKPFVDNGFDKKNVTNKVTKK